MNIYRIDGIRHQTVTFGAMPEGTVAQARASGEVGELYERQFVGP